MRESVKEKKVQKRYDEEFKRQAVELVIHSGKTQAQIAAVMRACPISPRVDSPKNNDPDLLSPVRA
jgi:hypothetical protein